MTEPHPITAAEAYALCTEITRLEGELSAARLESANWLAAMRAALGAAADGEPDPLAYLRDEIGDYPAGGSRR
jgi:hypothetical protein